MLLELLALLCFIAAGIWAAVERKSWPLVLLAAGLALWVATGLEVHID